MLTLEEAIKAEKAETLAYEECLNSLDDNMPTDMRNEFNKSLGKQMDYHRQLTEWLRELRVKKQIVTNVKEQCKVWKRNDFQNRDYGIGFISALSNIEGLIAYTEEQLEVNTDDN